MSVYTETPLSRNIFGVLSYRMTAGDFRGVFRGDSVTNPNAQTNGTMTVGRQRRMLHKRGFSAFQAHMNEGGRRPPTTGGDENLKGGGTSHTVTQTNPNGTSQLWPIHRRSSFSANLGAGPGYFFAHGTDGSNCGVPWLGGNQVDFQLVYLPNAGAVENARIEGFRNGVVVSTADVDFTAGSTIARYRASCGNGASASVQGRVRNHSTAYDETGRFIDVVSMGFVRPDATAGIAYNCIAYGGWGLTEHINNIGEDELAAWYGALGNAADGSRVPNTFVVQIYNDIVPATHRALMLELIEVERAASSAAGLPADEFRFVINTGHDFSGDPETTAEIAAINDEIAAQSNGQVGHVNLFRAVYHEIGEFDAWEADYTTSPGVDDHPNPAGADVLAMLEWRAYERADRPRHAPGVRGHARRVRPQRSRL